MELRELSNIVNDFCDERDWTQFHNIKDLAIGLSIESSELLQIFLWKSQEEIEDLLKNTSKKQDIEDEVSDILFFLLRIANLNDINLCDALKNKVIKNGLKYPVSEFKGSNRKYNEKK